MQNRFLGLFGLAIRARQVRSGAFAAEDTLKAGRAKLIVIADDCAENSKKDFIKLCEKYNVPYIITETKESLARMTGKSETAIAAVTDENFKKGLMNLVNTNGNVKI
ncbi:MAG: ribosomal L7Ae/L30e/S12e/Gadd45 family protein [Clostridia bacterium]|nr:ribosomal L7Ae/L30e/S12e/Gadd45 family protein [Clostridia bacterium]